ncbi:zinc finger, CCHC-type containing protein, partial [Tanacetum coccineum]
QVSCIIDKLSPSWKDFKRTLKHQKEELTLVELDSHLRIEESLRVQDNDKPKGNNVVDPSIVKMMEHNNSFRFCYVYLLHTKDEALDKFNVFKTEVELQQGSLIKRFRIDKGGEYLDTQYFKSVGIIHEMIAPHTPQQNGISKRKNRVLEEMVDSMLSYSGLSQGFWGKAMTVLRLPDPKLKNLGERRIECIFVRYAEQSNTFRFYVIKPNESVSINSIIKSRDVIFSVLRPSLIIPNGTEDIGGSVVPEEVIKKVVQQPELELRKSKRNRTLNNFGPEFQLYLIEGTMDEKEAINDEMNSIMGNNTWVLTDLPPSCKPLGCKWIFKRKLKVDGTIEKFKARLVIQGSKQKSGINSFDTYALVQAPKQWHQKFDEVVLSNVYLLNQADKCVYSKFDETGKGVIICLYVDKILVSGTYQVQVDLTKEFLSSRFSIKDMGEADVILVIKIKHESNGIAISQSHYIANVLKKFNYFDCTSAILQSYKDTLMQAGSASKKQNYITGSTMESEFVALAAAGKEVEWLRKLILKIPLWYKPITPISILCDSAATLAKSYSQMYNGKSRHLGVRHSMIRELIMNGMVSIEFVRSHQNLADHFTKELAKDLVIKSAEGMGLKFNQYYETVNLEQEVACLMLSSMSPDLQRILEKCNAFDMMKELKTMFEEQAKQELFVTVKAFHACKEENGQSLNSLNKDYDQFVQNYNMHSMGKTLVELHAMLKLHEKGIPKKVETSAVLAIREGKIQKDKNKLQGAKGKDKRKNKLAYTPKAKISPPPKRDNPAKDSICHHYKEGLKESRKLKHGALSLYMGNGMRAAVEAIRSFNLILPNNVFYFNAIPRDGIYEIDMHNIYPNVISMYNVINKRAKHALDSYYIWHFRLRHINKKRMDMLQRDGLLQPTHKESHEKCKSCISGKMAQKPFPHQVERAKDLLGLIHTDVCGPFRTVSREGVNYFITFIDDFSRYGFVYLMKHKHEVFENFKVFQNEVENQLGKNIKAIRSDRGGEYL